jgi:hypothetical protein
MAPLTAAQAGASPATAASLAAALAADPFAWSLPHGAIAQTFPRHMIGNGWGVASGDLNVTAINLVQGVTIHDIAVASASAAVTPTHWWYMLLDQNLGPLAQTSDQTTAAFAANTAPALAIASTADGSATSFTPTYTGLHFVGFMMAAATPVSLCGIGNGSNVPLTGVTPSLGGQSTTGLTTPPGFAAAGITPTTAAVFYAYVS